MMIKFFYALLILIFSTNSLFAKSAYLQEGIDLYNKSNFEKARFKFEQDIVYNPKSELSYLYLSKIFNKQDKVNLEEENLNTVMLLNPKNEEAIYHLAKLKVASSFFGLSKITVFKLCSCKSFLSKFLNIFERYK